MFNHEYLVPDAVNGHMVVSAFADPASFDFDGLHNYYLTIVQVTCERYDVVFVRWVKFDQAFCCVPGPFSEILGVDFFRANIVFADYVSRLVSRTGTDVG